MSRSYLNFYSRQFLSFNNDTKNTENLKKQFKHHKTVFDKIFMGHAIVDFLVGILVIPNYCIYSVFGYWPLGKMFCHLYIR